MELLSTWLARGNYLPHGYCFTWTPGLLWSMVIADGVIALAYYSIPIALVHLVRKRQDTRFNWIVLLFSAFIFACGTTHVLAIWTIWRPDYGLETLVKMVTAAISIVTAIVLWPLIPKALKIPSVSQLQAVIASLEAEARQRRHAEDSLLDSQESLAITLASIGAGFIATDADGRVTRMNPVAEQITGWPLADARGHSLWDVFRREHEPREQMRGNPVQALIHLDGKAEIAVRSVAVSRDGTHTPIEANSAVICGPDGAVRGMALVFHDVSQQERNDALRIKGIRLEAENRQIHEANRLKSEFLANMSHELRTPLNAIIGFGDLLHTKQIPHDSRKHHEFLGHIARSGRHLLQLINDLLDLSKVEAGKFEFFPEPLNLAEVVDEVTTITRSAAADKGVTVASEIDPALSDVVADPVRLKQVLYNYMSNAIKFTPRGGHVTVRARPEDGESFRIEVEDDGIGIAAGDLSRLFVEFRQLDAGYGKAQPGTGLGLALTRRLVEAQGGSVGVRSRPCEGSVFHAVLLRKPRNLAQHVEPSAPAGIGLPRLAQAFPP